MVKIGVNMVIKILANLGGRNNRVNFPISMGIGQHIICFKATLG